MKQRAFQMVMVATLGVNLYYLTYRTLYSLNWSSTYGMFASWLLLLAEVHCFLSLALFFFQVWSPVNPAPSAPLDGKTVDVLVPTYNEDLPLLRSTILACVRMKYPHETYVLDDGRRPQVKELADELGVHYVTRSDNLGAKAGNLNNALSVTRGEYVALFDADHIPEPNFLTSLMGYFHDDRMAMVQTPHTFYNIDSFQFQVDLENKRKWDEQEVFFQLIQPGRNRWNAATFLGSSVIFRRSALEEIGGFAPETITEDLHTGLRLHSRGWSTVYHNERLSSGLAGRNLQEYQTQRLRWAEGNLSVLAHDQPLTMPGLSLAQRLCYMASLMHWTMGFPKLIFLLTPGMMLFSGTPALSHLDRPLALLLLLNLVMTLSAVKLVAQGMFRLVESDLFAMTNFFVFIHAAFRALFRRGRSGFKVTQKSGSTVGGVWMEVMPQLLIITLSLTGMVWGVFVLTAGISHDVLAIEMSLCWTGLNLLFALAMVRRAVTFGDQRYGFRYPAFLPVLFKFNGPEGVRQGYGIAADLTDQGMSLTTYLPLPAEGREQLLLMAPGRPIELVGEVRWSLQRTDEEHASYRYGIAFQDLAPRERDGLALLCVDYAIPRLLDFFEPNPTFSQAVRAWWRSLTLHAVRSRRHAVRMPVVLQPTAPEAEREYTVTEDMSATGMQVWLEKVKAIGDVLEFDVLTPMGEIRGAGRIVREKYQPIGPRMAYVCGIEFTAMRDHSKEHLEAFLASGIVPAELRGLTAERRPVRGETPHLMPVLFVSALLLASEYGAFQLLNRDSLDILRMTRRGVTEADAPRLLSIFETFRGRPDRDLRDLMLLTDLLLRIHRDVEGSEILKAIVEKNPDNLGYRLKLADTLSRAQRYRDAEQSYLVLEAMLSPATPPLDQVTCLMAAARNAVRLALYDLAGDRFLRAIKEDPRNLRLRDEAAGVLTSAGRLKEAQEQYKAIVAQDVAKIDARYGLIGVYVAGGNFEAAEAVCRKLLAEGKDNEKARVTLAEILTWKQEYAEAMEQYERLKDSRTAGAETRARLAHLALWRKDYDLALRWFQELLNDHVGRTELWPGFLDAAASAGTLGPDQRKTVLKIVENMNLPIIRRPVLLARLSWVLRRLEEHRKSIEVLEHAIQLDPVDRRLRLHLADALHDLGDFDGAETHYVLLLKTLQPLK